MRKLLLLAALAILPVMAATPAFACSCARDADGKFADAVLADPAVSVADVTVRGYNKRNGQSMLQIDNIRHGSLVARDIRARFDAQSSCGIVPGQPKMTLLIKNENDGTYSIMGDCAHTHVLSKLKGQ